MLEVRPEYVMALLDAIEGRMELAGKSTGNAAPEELGDGIGRNRGEGELTGALEQAVDGEVAVEDQIAAPLDLGDEAVPAQSHPGVFLFRELRSEQEGPVVDALPDNGRAEPVGDVLESFGIGNGEERVIVHPVARTLAAALPFHEVMAVEIPGGLEGEEGPDPQHHGSQHVIEDVEVVVGEAASTLFRMR